MNKHNERAELPPLPTCWRKVPDADGVEVDVFRAFQMRDYARAAMLEAQPAEQAKGQEVAVPACVSGSCPNKKNCNAACHCLYTTPPAQPAREWQPIETAPKDGALIVVRGNNHGDEELGQHHCIACWHGGAWMEASDWNPTSELTHLTHWAPLPEDITLREKNAGLPAAVPAFDYTDEKAAIEAAKNLSLIGVTLNEHGAVALCHAFKMLAAPKPQDDLPAILKKQAS